MGGLDNNTSLLLIELELMGKFISFSSIILLDFAIDIAVFILSPVTIITFTEASLHFNTASLTPFLIVSLIPKTAKRIKLFVSIFSFLFSKSSSVISL